MDENNTANTTETTAVSKPEKVKQKKDKDNKKSFASVFNIYKGEFKKIAWPSRKDLVKQTITVIVISVMVGIIIMGYNSVFSVGLKYLVQLLG